MVKKIIFNTVIVIVLIMIGAAILKANKPRPSVFKATLSDTQKEAKYYRVIE